MAAFVRSCAGDCPDAVRGEVMSRLDLAYLLVALLLAAVSAVWVLSYRFRRYQRAIRQGHRDTPRVWHPFWLP